MLSVGARLGCIRERNWRARTKRSHVRARLNKQVAQRRAREQPDWARCSAARNQVAAMIAGDIEPVTGFLDAAPPSEFTANDDRTEQSISFWPRRPGLQRDTVR
jgi:hypothetical protein